MKRLLRVLMVAGVASALAEEGDPVDAEAPPTTVAEADATEELPPRARYNLGLTLLDEQDYEGAASEFLAARDDAGPDPQLRYRAAFNLGVALAESVPAETPPEQAIEVLRRSAAWFGDAVRLAPPEDDDARINLELVSRRVMALADQLNQDGRLEARLERLIDDQRGVRDQVRGLLADIANEGAGAEPLGFSAEFEGIAGRQRVLAADVGDSIDLAAEELSFIEQTPPDERTQEQLGRAYQLARVIGYLERARQSLTDARLRLRRLEGERAHRRVDAALAEMKRAREQLYDPVRVLQAVARDESELLLHTSALAAYGDVSLQLEETPPPWLTARHLGERQEDIAARTGGTLSHFEALAAADEAAQADAAAMRAVAEATPLVDRALAAMRDSRDALAANATAPAAAAQQRSLADLQQAIEQFAGVKQLIEIAYADQAAIVALLDPDAQAPASQQELPAAERAEAVFAHANANQGRLQRLETLLKEEAEAADAAEEGEEEAVHQARQAAQQRYRQAEALRSRALAELDALQDEVERLANTDTAQIASPSAARKAATEALAAIEELRRLYFSIVEHLQALLAEQADTHDRTATLQFESAADMGEEFAAELGLAAAAQARHGGIGDALAEALAAQADAAAATPQDATGTATEPPSQASEQARQAAERFAEAAAETRKASGRMHSASTLLADAEQRAGAMSPELEPALDDQLAAVEHLENALRALAPPSGDNQQQEGESGDAQQPQPQQQAAEEEQMSQRQALRRLQAIRDREAERQRRREQRMQPQPVEKDW